jgi:cell division protein FtsW (lipid II flippase)
MALFDKKEPTGKWWVDHSLSLVLLALMLVVGVVSAIAGYQVWEAEENQVEFWIYYLHTAGSGFFDEIMGVLLIVMLSKWFYERGSAESK